MNRPLPPPSMLTVDGDEDGDLFEYRPAPELEEWIRTSFIGIGKADGPIPPTVNPDHVHLADATIGCLWTNEKNVKGMKRVGATAEMPMSQGDAWKRGRFDYQLRKWFGIKPTFVLTFDAFIATRLNDISFCAMCEHELYHCAQKLDSYGYPAFSQKTGLPLFGLKAHDVEEFTPIIERYGPSAGAGDTVNFIKAASQPPLFGRANLDCICGTCGR